MKTHQAEVINCVIAKTKYGRKLVLNCKLLSDNSQVACWSNELGNKVYRSKHKGDIVELIESDKGKFSVLDKEPPHNINGAGLKSVKEIMPNIPKSNGYANGTNATQQAVNSAVEDYLDNDLGLPELLTDRQKQDLKKLTVERARLLVFCIETMKNEMDAKGFEFYENSVRSLGVSLFIQITRYLP
ncbi:hypothetical protein [Pleurocapsa sp. PCC 7319]|uniref:hypothetical protein n=1 Tax=Pleurocapsa sp. PCC 7319 TaxID=118161 RepID=UPI00034CB3B0|nr:hypothetical protein [Pleurocapsa sp. PCC 7319]